MLVLLTLLIATVIAGIIGSRSRDPAIYEVPLGLGAAGNSSQGNHSHKQHLDWSPHCWHIKIRR